MSDLSGLNPTPHAIAVYASSPLSPVATQHSLPSGRYSLLGPDFHRLDRTSLRLAHSFDHLVGAGEQCRPSATLALSGALLVRRDHGDASMHRVHDLAPRLSIKPIGELVQPLVQSAPKLNAGGNRWRRFDRA